MKKGNDNQTRLEANMGVSFYFFLDPDSSYIVLRIIDIIAPLHDTTSNTGLAKAEHTQFCMPLSHLLEKKLSGKTKLS